MNLDELQRVAEEATPGPRWVDDRRPDGALQIQAQHRGAGSSYCVATVNFWEAPDDNAAFIAAFDPPTVLKLLAIARAAKAVDALVIPPIVEPAFEALRQSLEGVDL